MTFDSQAYGPAVAALLRIAPANELGAGTPVSARGPRWKRSTAPASWRREAVKDRDMAAACLAGLWLRFDFLDESHRISQDIETPTGSYWHGVMHRREGDFGNAKYWFRRVGQHPVFEPLCAAAGELAGERPPRAARFLAEQSSWDPFKFVDLCQQAVAASELRPLAIAVQQREWELLWEFSYRRAING